MECPACKVDSDANYVGIIHIECVNPHCKYYSDKARKLYDEAQGPPKAKEEENPFDTDEITDPIWTQLGALFPRK